MSISWTAKILIPEQVLKRELDGESVILNLQSEEYFGLDEIGTRMLSALVESGSMQKAYEILLAEYEVEPETLRGDLQNLVERLRKDGIIEIQE